MPSPIGHALGGIAAGWLLEPQGSIRTLPGGRHAATLAFAALGMAADLDLLAGTHRGVSHSLGAAALVGLVAWALLRRAGRGRLAIACAAAYASHVLLDWLGSDTSPPIGLPALWPASTAYFEAPWHLFLAISRRVHQPDLFWRPNALALARELLILLPAVALAAYLRRIRAGRRQAIAATVTMWALGAGVIQGAPGPLPARAGQEPSAYVEAVVRYLAGGFDDAVDAVAGMSESDIRDQAGALQKDWKTAQAAAMLHTEAAFRPGVDTDERMATFHLTRARQLVRDLRRVQSAGEFQRGWYLLLSAQLQGLLAFDAVDTCLDEARSVFPRDPDVLVASGAAFELRVSSAPLPRIEGQSVESRPRPDPDVRRALESSVRYLTAAAAAAPAHDEARLRLGRVLHRLGKVDQAAAELEIVRKRTADRELEYLATVFEAAIETDRGRLDRATALYQHAVDVLPGQAGFIGLSLVYYGQGRGPDAARALEGVFRQPPPPDPWFAYLTGDAWHLDARRAAMRALVTRP